jgi:hypothetical protein
MNAEHQYIVWFKAISKKTGTQYDDSIQVDLESPISKSQLPRVFAKIEACQPEKYKDLFDYKVLSFSKFEVAEE